MLPRVLEPEVMDSAEEAHDYDAMDHGTVNRLFVEDFLAGWDGSNPILDVGTGTAQLAGDRDQLGQLHRALDLRVARQDLLDQRRARARQADDEDRVGRGRAEP